jgi:hypothetical protein
MLRILVERLLVFAIVATLTNAANIVKEEITPFRDIKCYSISGSISLPYAQIVEPFDAWYDAEQGASRIDYYGVRYHTQFASILRSIASNFH